MKSDCLGIGRKSCGHEQWLAFELIEGACESCIVACGAELWGEYDAKFLVKGEKAAIKCPVEKCIEADAVSGIGPPFD